MNQLPDEQATRIYFSNLFLEKPTLLNTRTNEKACAAWLKDHPEFAEVPNGVKQILSSVKSTMRKQRQRNHSARAETPPGTQKEQGPASEKTASASPESMTHSDYFVKLLKQNPQWLNDRSNDRIWEAWLKDHPKFDEVPLNVKQILSNIKVRMRHDLMRKKRSR